MTQPRDELMMGRIILGAVAQACVRTGYTWSWAAQRSPGVQNEEIGWNKNGYI